MNVANFWSGKYCMGVGMFEKHHKWNSTENDWMNFQLWWDCVELKWRFCSIMSIHFKMDAKTIAAKQKANKKISR